MSAVERMPARAMTRAEAAAYCGVTLSGFADWQRRGIVPGPMAGTKRWDRIALDRALDKASGLRQADESETPFKRWKREQDARSA